MMAFRISCCVEPCGSVFISVSQRTSSLHGFPPSWCKQTLGLAAPKWGQMHLREHRSEGAKPAQVALPGFVGSLLFLAAATVPWAGGSAAPLAHGTQLRSCGTLMWAVRTALLPAPSHPLSFPMLLAVAPDGMEEAMVQYPVFVCASACVLWAGWGQRAAALQLCLLWALGFGAEGLSPALACCCYCGCLSQSHTSHGAGPSGTTSPAKDPDLPDGNNPRGTRRLPLSAPESRATREGPSHWWRFCTNKRPPAAAPRAAPAPCGCGSWLCPA